MELKQAHDIQPNFERSVQYFLDRFYINRISIRMLINQHGRSMQKCCCNFIRFE